MLCTNLSTSPVPAILLGIIDLELFTAEFSDLDLDWESKGQLGKNFNFGLYKQTFQSDFFIPVMVIDIITSSTLYHFP